MYPSAYNNGWQISISFQIQNYRVHGLCSHFHRGPVPFRRQVGAWGKKSEIIVFVYFEMLCWLCCLVFCLFTRLFQNRRISLTLSLFFTSLFTSVMPQLCFPTNLVPFYRICLAFKFRMLPWLEMTNASATEALNDRELRSWNCSVPQAVLWGFFF